MPYGPQNAQTPENFTLLKEFQVDGKVLRIDRDEDGRITDVQILCNDKEAHALNLHFSEKQHNKWMTSCYTKIFQDELADFKQKCLAHPHFKDIEDGDKKLEAFTDKLRTYSEYYADLEGLINQMPVGVGIDPFKALFKRLDELKANLEKLQKDNPKLAAPLLAHLEFFRKEVERAKNQRTPPLSQQQIRMMFSTLSSDTSIPSLGRFLAVQNTLLARTAIDQVYELLDIDLSNKPWNRFKQAFVMHPLIKSLMSISRNIEYKGLTDYGARYLNGRNPIPQSMLKNLGPGPEKEGEAQWTSIYPYLKRKDDLEDIAQIVNFLNDKPTTTSRTPPYWFWQTAALLANIPEVAVSLARIALASAAVTLHLVLNGTVNLLKLGLGLVTGTLGFLTGGPSRAKAWFNAAIEFGNTINKGFEKFFEFIDNDLSLIHRGLSLMIFCKKKRNEALNIDDTLKHQLNEPDSVYNLILNYFSASKMTGLIRKGFETFYTMTVAFGVNLRKGITEIASRSWSVTLNAAKITANVFLPAAMKFEVKTYDQLRRIRIMMVSAKYVQKLQKDYQDKFNEYQEFQKSLEGTQNAANPDKGTSQNIQPEIKTRPIPTPWTANQISSPIDFVDEIFIGLSSIIRRMFDFSPGSATFFFLLANASFGALTFPAAFSAAFGSQATSYVALLPTWISKAFMGKEVGAAMPLNNLFASFLQWKVTFVPVEVLIEAAHDPTLLKEVFHNPEEITLGMSIMCAMGFAMHYIPEIPEITIPIDNDPTKLVHLTQEAARGYLGAINLFTHEAKEVTEFGQPPLTGLEYAFLSLKSIFLIENMLTGGVKATYEVDKEVLDVLQPKEMESMHGKSRSYDKLSLISAEIKKIHKSEKYKDTKTLSALVQKLGPEQFKAQIIAPALANLNIHSPKVIDFVFAAMKLGFQDAKASADQGAQALKDLLLQAATPEGQVDMKRRHLSNLVDGVICMELMGQKFDNVLDAEAYYDDLYHTIKEYNQAQRKLGNWDQLIDKEQFLHSFYNKHIYPQYASNNMARLISWIPFFFLTAPWRFLQSLSASPATQYKIKRLASDDVSVAFQSLAMVEFTGSVLSLAYTYGALALMLTATAPVSFVLNVVDFAVRALTFSGFPDKSKNEVYLGTNFFNRVIDFAHFATPYNHLLYSLRTLPSRISNLITGNKASSYEAFEEKKSTQAAYAAHAKIAGRGETLKEDAVNLNLQLKAHAEYAETHKEAMPIREFKRQHADTKNHFLTKYWHKGERRQEKALLETYARELRTLERLCDTLSSKRMDYADQDLLRDSKTLLEGLKKHKPEIMRNIQSQIDTMQDRNARLALIEMKIDKPKPSG